MDTTTLLPLIVIFIAVAIILFLVTGGIRTKTTPGKKGLARLAYPSQAPGFPSALVATTAAATALSTTGANPWTTGALLGTLTATLNLHPLAPLRKILYATAAITGTITTLTTTLTATPLPGCTPPGALGTWFTILLATITALAATAGWAIGHTPTTPLAFFSALTIISFLSSPLGVPAFATTNPALTAGIAITTAALFGFTAGRFPAPITGLAAIAITLTTINTAAFITPTCNTLHTTNLAYTLIAAATLYTLLHLATTPLRKTRTAT